MFTSAVLQPGASGAAGARAQTQFQAGADGRITRFSWPASRRNVAYNII